MTDRNDHDCECKRTGSEYLDYIYALEFSIATSALKTNPPDLVAGLLHAMRKEFAPHVRINLAPLEQVVEGLGGEGRG